MSDTEPRIRPPADLEREVLDRLKGKIFPTKARALLFAGALGFHLKRPEPIESFGEGIRLEYFEDDAKIIDVIAMAAKSDLGLLRADRRREAFEIFEQYAHGGLLHIKETCFTGERTVFEGL